MSSVNFLGGQPADLVRVVADPCDCRIEVQTQIRENTVEAAFLGTQGKAVLDSFRRAFVADHLAFQRHGAALAGACAEQRFQQLGTARAQQARNAQDLAFMQVEGNIMDVVAQVIQVLHDQNFFADGSLLRRETVCQFTADHQADDFIHIRFCGAHRLDERTVAHDSDIIRNAEDFLHLMGNVDDAFPLACAARQ